MTVMHLMCTWCWCKNGQNVCAADHASSTDAVQAKVLVQGTDGHELLLDAANKGNAQLGLSLIHI